jgi:hypothetical protein
MARWNPFGRADSDDPGRGRGDRLRALTAAADAAIRAEDPERLRVVSAELVLKLQDDLRSRPEDVESCARIGRHLYDFGFSLGVAGRYADAVDVLDGVVTVFAALAAHDSRRWGPLVAEPQQSLAGALSELGRWPEAVRASRQAVELQRMHGGVAPAVALRMFARACAGAGVELDAAQQAITEAQALHMTALTTTLDRKYLEQLYRDELVLADVLARQGQQEDAARVRDLARSGHLDGLLELLRAQRPH